MRSMPAFVLSLAVLCLCGCAEFGSRGDVYVTVDTIGATLITVKFLEPTDNAGSYPNSYYSYREIVTVGDYDWYRYEVPAGTYDAYIEWSGGIGFNGRARIMIAPESSADQWAAVYADSGGNVWAETGGGAFAPGLYHYP